MARIESEKIVLSSPMSFTGSAKRLHRWMPAWMFWTLGLVVLAAWWAIDLAWLILFGIFLVPYRIVRRGSRKRKLSDVRHREILEATRPAAPSPNSKGPDDPSGA